MLESSYQAQLIEELPQRFHCFVLKNDPAFRQGIPDLTVLFDGGGWGELEVKTSAQAPYRPNQEYYLELFGRMCFSATIYPENQEDVFRALEHAFPHARRR